MKAIVFEGPNRVSIQEKPIPKLEDGDILIQVDLCGVCASDLAAIRGEVTDYSPPVVLGHEVAGRVVETKHPSVKVGQKVSVNPMITCGDCQYCRADLDKYCQEIVGIGHDIDGGYAEYFKFPRHAIQTSKLITVSDNVSTTDLMFLEPLGCCINAMRETIFNQSVVILGAGQIGLIFTQLVDQLGLQAIVVDPITERREMAERLGAVATFTPKQTEEILEQTNGGADTVISATNNNQTAIGLSFQIIRRGGCLNFFGLSAHDQYLKLNLEQLHFMGHKIMASWAFSRWSLDQAHEMISDQKIKLEPILSNRFPISEGLEAIEQVKKSQGIKTAILGSPNST